MSRGVQIKSNKCCLFASAWALSAIYRCPSCRSHRFFTCISTGIIQRGTIRADKSSTAIELWSYWVTNPLLKNHPQYMTFCVFSGHHELRECQIQSGCLYPHDYQRWLRGCPALVTDQDLSLLSSWRRMAMLQPFPKMPYSCLHSSCKSICCFLNGFSSFLVPHFRICKILV